MTDLYTNNNVEMARSYYNFMLTKDFDRMATCLADNVEFISPLGEMSGKAEVVKAAQGFSQIIEDIQIRSAFYAGDDIMIAYDFILTKIGKLRAACLMEFDRGVISRIELFYDSKPFI